MKKDFDQWNKEKKRIDALTMHAVPFAHKQWVWMCSLGVNIGSEEDGGVLFERPALVIAKINNQMYWVVPLSSKQRPFDFYYNFTDPEGRAVSALPAQLRLVSAKRFRRRMYRMPDTHFDAIASRIIGYVKHSKPRTGRGSSELLERSTVSEEYPNASGKSTAGGDNQHRV